MALLMLHVLCELLLLICMTLVHNTAWGSMAFFLPAARPRLIPRSRKDRRLSRRLSRQCSTVPRAAMKGFYLKIPCNIHCIYWGWSQLLVQGDGELPTISNSAKKCFIFITFRSTYPVGNDHLNLSLHTPQLQGMHLLIPLYIFEKILFSS